MQSIICNEILQSFSLVKVSKYFFYIVPQPRNVAQAYFLIDVLLIFLKKLNVKCDNFKTPDYCNLAKTLVIFFFQPIRESILRVVQMGYPKQIFIASAADVQLYIVHI